MSAAVKSHASAPLHEDRHPHTPSTPRLASPPPPKPAATPVKEESPTKPVAKPVTEPLTPPKSPAKDKTEDPEDSEDSEEDSDEPSYIDMETFTQILELDEVDEDGENDYAFSKEMVNAYFEQAEKTFKEMDDALREKDLHRLSELGHFLKGSSAALGLCKVQASCESMQHLGSGTTGNALAEIGTLLPKVKKEYAQAEKWLQRYFGI